MEKVTLLTTEKKEPQEERKVSQLLIFVIAFCIFGSIAFIFSLTSYSIPQNLRGTLSLKDSYDIFIVSDLDKRSKVISDKKGKWMSVFMK